MAVEARSSERVFKTAWFAKAAGKAEIGDDELCNAIREVMVGQADDLGGGVYKKRLKKNLYRSLILAKGGRNWVYEFLFAKSDRANIEDTQLANLQRLAKVYGALTDRQLNELIEGKKWMEICR
jgi:hypothetical protein